LKDEETTVDAFPRGPRKKRSLWFFCFSRPAATTTIFVFLLHLVNGYRRRRRSTSTAISIDNNVAFSSEKRNDKQPEKRQEEEWDIWSWSKNVFTLSIQRLLYMYSRLLVTIHEFSPPRAFPSVRSFSSTKLRPTRTFSDFTTTADTFSISVCRRTRRTTTPKIHHNQSMRRKSCLSATTTMT